MKYLILISFMLVSSINAGILEGGNGKYTMHTTKKNIYILNTETGELWTRPDNSAFPLVSIPYTNVKTDTWKIFKDSKINNKPKIKQTPLKISN